MVAAYMAVAYMAVAYMAVRLTFPYPALVAAVGSALAWLVPASAPALAVGSVVPPVAVMPVKQVMMAPVSVEQVL